MSLSAPPAYLRGRNSNEHFAALLSLTNAHRVYFCLGTVLRLHVLPSFCQCLFFHFPFPVQLLLPSPRMLLFLLQVLLAVLLLLVALFGSWYVVWRLILSKFPFFQEILGLRPRVNLPSAGGAVPAIQTAEQAAALKKRKQKEANTIILTRSGEQMAALKRRESIRAAQLAQQAAMGGRPPPQPTTTPMPPSTPTAHRSGTRSAHRHGSATPMGFPSSSSSATPSAALRSSATGALHHQRTGSGSPGTPSLYGAPSLSMTPAVAPSHPSALPTSNPAAPAIVTAALHRRRSAL